MYRVDELERQASVERYALSGPDNWAKVDSRLERLAVLGQRVAGSDSEFSIAILDNEDVRAVRADPARPLLVLPRSASPCDRLLAGVRSRDVILVADPSQDPRLSGAPWVAGSDAPKFIAIAPLIGQEGYALGGVCIFSTRNRQASEALLVSLADLRDTVMRALTDRRREHRT